MVDTNISVDTDNLDDFALLYEGKAEVKEVDASEDNPLANEQTEEPDPVEKDIDPVEAEEEVDIPDEDQKESDKLNLKPKKKSVQERIDELTAARREAEREAEAARAELAELKKAQPKIEEKVTTPAPAVETAKGPSPDAVLETGEAKYPLGEFDPQFISDLADHIFTRKSQEMDAREEAKRQEAETFAAVQALNESWQERVAEVTETLPDLQEKGVKLEPILSGLPKELGEYVAQTIMSLEHGPEVLYYLADNLGEAQKMFSGGARTATLGLGELNAMFKRKEAPVKKVTEAPEPPARNRGNAARFEVADDTDDLAAFGKKFYNK